MKKQVKLSENELYKVIKESVKSLVLEYGEKNPKVRSAMAKAASNAIKRGDDSVYHKAVSSITKAGGSKEALSDFGDKFEKSSKELERIYERPTDYDEDFDDELNSHPANNLATEGRKQMKVTESQLKDIIKESVVKILSEIHGLHGNNRKDWFTVMNKRLKQADDAEDDASFISSLGDVACPGDAEKAYDKVKKINRAGGRDQYFAHGGKSYISKKDKPNYKYFYNRFIK